MRLVYNKKRSAFYDKVSDFYNALKASDHWFGAFSMLEFPMRLRIDRSTVPKGKFQYEVAEDDESGGEPARVQLGVIVNFFGTLICDEPLPIGDKGILWLLDEDFVWL